MPDVSDRLGSILVCLLLSASLNGMSLTQSLCYYRISHGDKLRIKLVVAFICLIQSVQTALGITWAYECLISRAGDLEGLNVLRWPACAHVGLGFFSALIVQICNAVRIWQSRPIRSVLSRPKQAISVLTGLLGLASFVVGIAAVGTGYKIQTWTKRRSSELIATLGGIAFALALAVDIVQPAMMLHALRCSRGERNTVSRSLVGVAQVWTVYLSGTGMFTSIIALTALILFWLNRSDLLFLGLMEIRSRLYATCFLSSLTARRHSRMDKAEAVWTSWDFGRKSDNAVLSTQIINAVDSYQSCHEDDLPSATAKAQTSHV